MVQEGTKKKDAAHDLNKNWKLENITSIRQANKRFRWFFVSSSKSAATFTVQCLKVDWECTLVVELNGVEIARIHMYPEATRYVFTGDIESDEDGSVNDLAFHITEDFHRTETAFVLNHVEVDTVLDTDPEPTNAAVEQEPRLHVIRTWSKPDATHVKFYCEDIPKPTAWIMGMTPLEMQSGCFSPMDVPGHYMGMGFKPNMRPGDDGMVLSIINFGKKRTRPARGPIFSNRRDWQPRCRL